MKAGELAGLCHLAPDIADRVLPRLIVPPLEERDETFQQELLATQKVPDIAGTLAAHWRGREVFVEATHLLSDFGRDAAGYWLPGMLERARRAHVQAIPLVALGDLTAASRATYKASCSPGPVRLGVVVPSADLEGRDALLPLLDHLEAMGLEPADCSVVADFSGSEFGRPEVVAPIISGALELLQEVGTWRQVVFQGTNYPDRNPAEPGTRSVVPRNEWIAWCQAVAFDKTTADHMIFGDYGADCATMVFGAAGARAIRHYRYTTPEAWLVQRGAASGVRDAANMRDVCTRIVDSPEFAGRSFSSADEYIFQTAQGEGGPGNSTTWRAVNTTHHITRVVADIGGVLGFDPRRRAASPASAQGILFDGP